MDWILMVIWRNYLWILLVVFCLALAACSRSVDLGDNSVPPNPLPTDLTQSEDQTTGNWNSKPHGGYYEKSNRSPCGPVE